MTSRTTTPARPLAAATATAPAPSPAVPVGEEEKPFRVTVLGDPTRIVVDVAH